MSQTVKIVLGIVVLAAIVGGLYYWNQTHEAKEPTPNGTETTSLPSGNSTTDGAIEQDVTSIDAQLDGVSQDNANANASVNAAAAQ